MLENLSLGRVDEPKLEMSFLLQVNWNCPSRASLTIMWKQSDCLLYSLIIKLGISKRGMAPGYVPVLCNLVSAIVNDLPACFRARWAPGFFQQHQPHRLLKPQEFACS